MIGFPKTSKRSKLIQSSPVAKPKKLAQVVSIKNEEEEDDEKEEKSPNPVKKHRMFGTSVGDGDGASVGDGDGGGIFQEVDEGDASTPRPKVTKTEIKKSTVSKATVNRTSPSYKTSTNGTRVEKLTRVYQLEEFKNRLVSLPAFKTTYFVEKLRGKIHLHHVLFTNESKRELLCEYFPLLAGRGSDDWDIFLVQLMMGIGMKSGVKSVATLQLQQERHEYLRCQVVDEIISKMNRETLRDLLG